jgi:hypothetical protein
MPLVANFSSSIEKLIADAKGARLAEAEALVEAA